MSAVGYLGGETQVSGIATARTTSGPASRLRIAPGRAKIDLPEREAQQDDRMIGPINGEISSEAMAVESTLMIR